MNGAPLRILTLNIGSLLEPRWDERRHLIVDGINQLEPDVVCLQEVCDSHERPNTGRWIAEHATEEWYSEFGGFDVGDAVLFGSSVLSRWPIDDHVVHRLPVGADPNDTVKSVAWELFHATTAGLDLFSTHLAPAPDDQPHRMLQVAAIDRLIKAARGPSDGSVFDPERGAMPPLLCGDFNAEPDSDEIRFLTSLTNIEGHATFYQDAWRVAGDGSPGYTNDWTLGGMAALLNVHRKRIDYIFVGDPFLRAGNGGRVLSCTRVFDEPVDGLLASDHCGMLAEVIWPTRPPTAGLAAPQFPPNG